MFYIRKYTDCWAIHNDDTGQSRSLTNDEVETAKKEFPQLADEKLRTVFIDAIASINTNLSGNNNVE